MKKSILLTIGFLTLLIISSCGDDDDSLQSFLVDNTWNYSGTNCN